jgi:hypothetical protein
MAADEIHALDHEAVLVGDDLQHAPALAAILPGRHKDGVIPADGCLQP